MNAPISADDPALDAVREWFLALGSDRWLPLLTSARDDWIRFGSFCALAPPSYRAEAVRGPGWDLLHGSSGPGFVQGSDGGGGLTTTYLRFTSEPVEPLVVEREFAGVRPAYVELAEEFRLFHNLYSDPQTGQIVKIDEAGNDQPAAEVEVGRVIVRTPLVRQFQAARQLDLLLFVDTVVYYDPALPAPSEQVWRTDELHAVRHVGEVQGRPFSHFLATRVLAPPTIDCSGIWPYEQRDTHFPDFIIAEDDLGESVTSTCDPEALANNFGANAEAADYLTPVHFRRDVLVKYYERPELYTVEDGYLRCRGLWGLNLDNDNPNTVVVFLGDLGRDLPASERDYWRSFNIPPTAQMSETAFRRAMMAEFADATSTDLQFRVAYPDLNKAWHARYGWRIFRQPEPGDAHLLDVIRRPLTNDEAEFEDLVRTLAKLLVDFLNEDALSTALPPGPADERGIAKLARWLEAEGYEQRTRDIQFLRNLQTVRSKGVAHRKGSDYEKALDRIFGTKRNAAAGTEFLEQSLSLIRDLTAFAEAGTVPIAGSASSQEESPPD